MKIFKIFFFFFPIIFLCCECETDMPSLEDDELVIEEQDACQNIEATVEAGMLMYLPINSEDVSNVIDPEIFAVNNGGNFVNDRLGNSSKAIAFNRDEEQYIEIVNPIKESLRSFTISFWMKNFHLSSVGGYIMSLRGDSRFDIIVDSDKINFTTVHWKNGFISTQTIACEINNPSDIYGEWAHIVFRYNHQDRADAFVNGSPRGTVDLSDEWINYSDSAGGSGFGCNNTNNTTPTEFWSGELDDVRIYERSLCIPEIEYLANQ